LKRSSLTDNLAAITIDQCTEIIPCHL
jgi:hypothetical protein